MAPWVVNRAYILEQNAQKMERWRAEQNAKTYRQMCQDGYDGGCELCDGKINADGVCTHCGQIQTGD